MDEQLHGPCALRRMAPDRAMTARRRTRLGARFGLEKTRSRPTGYVVLHAPAIQPLELAPVNDQTKKR